MKKYGENAFKSWVNSSTSLSRLKNDSGDWHDGKRADFEASNATNDRKNNYFDTGARNQDLIDEVGNSRADPSKPWGPNDNAESGRRFADLAIVKEERLYNQFFRPEDFRSEVGDFWDSISQIVNPSAIVDEDRRQSFESVLERFF